MLFTFLTIVQAIVAAALVGIILIQKSEGGGLGVGGSPSGLMSARGAGDLLTRTTAVLAVLFVALSIALAVVAVGAHSSSSIDQTLERSRQAPAVQTEPALSGDPLEAAGAAEDSGAAAPQGADVDPLSAATGE